MKTHSFASSITVFALLFASAAHAQTTFATITGTAVDATGAVIANARVTATNVDTGIKTEAFTNDVGNYTIPQLNQGRYELRAQATGFKEFVA